jgi:choline kinase
MKAIIIAAGPCKRLRPLTDETPKCMLKIKGKPIIENMIELFRNNGIDDVSIIRGYKKEKIDFPNVTYFENTDFWNNNILQSLMFARPKLEEAIKTGEDVVMTYSDIWYNDGVVKKLVESKQDLAGIVDTEWDVYYEGRTDHPISEAENVIMDENKLILKIGKHIFVEKLEKDKQGEFIGLWKFSPKGIKTFLEHFDRLDAKLGMTDKFQNTAEWQKAYMTDIWQEMIDEGVKTYGVLIQQNWMEFDTVQDFKKANGEV